MLESGFLIKNKHGASCEEVAYTMRLLHLEHLEQMMILQDVIITRLSRKEMLEVFSLEFMREHLGVRGIVIGIFVDERLVAFRNVFFPDSNDKEWNLGRDLRFSKVELNKTANLQMVCVHPDFRGNSLGLKMNSQAIALIRQRSAIRHLFASVSPYNYWNINILLRSGFVIRLLKDKYGGKLRYIVYQDLKEEKNIYEKPSVSVGLTNFTQQLPLFNEGYAGVQIRKRLASAKSVNGLSSLRKRQLLAEEYELLFASQKQIA